MKRIVISLTLLAIVATGVNAQSFLNRLRDRAVNAVTNTIENKVENAAQEATEDALSGKKSKKNNASDDEEADEEEAPSKQKKTAKGEELVGMTYEPLFPYFADLKDKAFRVVSCISSTI